MPNPVPILPKAVRVSEPNRTSQRRLRNESRSLIALMLSCEDISDAPASLAHLARCQDGTAAGIPRLAGRHDPGSAPRRVSHEGAGPGQTAAARRVQPNLGAIASPAHREMAWRCLEEGPQCSQ